MTASDLPPVVLLGGSVNALSACRSLGARGIRVHALAEKSAVQPVRWSRYVTDHIPFPGGSVQTWWREWLTNGPHGAVLIPTSDHGLEFIATNRGFLMRLGYRPVEANDDLLLAMLDKAETYRVASEAGLEAPRAVRVKGLDDLAAHQFDFPCAVKPIASHRPSSGFHARKALLVHDDGELERVVAETADTDAGVVVTEVVPGPDESFCSYYTYMVDGEPLFHYTKRKVRQHPIHFGDGTFHVSDDVPEARELGLKLFRAAGLTGLGNVEFKRDARDGRLKVIECNLRLTAADPMIRAGGLDLAHLLYERACGRSGPSFETSGRITRQWHPAKDLRAFLQYRRAGELSTRAWLRSLLGAHCLPLFASSDPRPSVGNAAAAPRRLFRLLRRRARAHRPDRVGATTSG